MARSSQWRLLGLQEHGSWFSVAAVVLAGSWFLVASVGLAGSWLVVLSGGCWACRIVAHGSQWRLLGLQDRG